MEFSPRDDMRFDYNRTIYFGMSAEEVSSESVVDLFGLFSFSLPPFKSILIRLCDHLH